MKKIRNLAGKIKDNLVGHFIDTTALLAESTPVYAAFETKLAGMSDEISINARLFAAGLSYFAGMGWAFARGRDLSRKLFKIKDETNEGLQYSHDTGYCAAFNLVLAPPIYYASGSRDLTEIAIGTGAAMVFSLVNGWPLGYSVDLFRDLTGLNECNRPSYPDIIKRQTPRIKKTLAGLLVIGAIALTAGIYALTPDQSVEVNKQQPQIVEQYDPQGK